MALHPAEWIALLDVAGDVDLLPEALARAVGPHSHALGMLAEAVELEPQLEDVAPARELQPENAVPAVAHTGVGLVDALRGRAAEEHLAGVVEGVAVAHRLVEVLLGAVAMQAPVWLPAVEVTLQWLALLVYLHGAHVRHHGLGLGLEDADELPQELGRAAVITLCDPYVAASRQRQPPLPLGEGATAVVLIGDVVADLGMGGVAL